MEVATVAAAEAATSQPKACHTILVSSLLAARVVAAGASLRTAITCNRLPLDQRNGYAADASTATAPPTKGATFLPVLHAATQSVELVRESKVAFVAAVAAVSITRIRGTPNARVKDGAATKSAATALESTLLRSLRLLLGAILDRV